MVYKLPHKEAEPPRLNLENVPIKLRQYISLAEKYGISDDGYRDEVVNGLDDKEKKELVVFLVACENELEEWLAGLSSYDEPSSTEYVTFSCLLMAADYAKSTNT